MRLTSFVIIWFMVGMTAAYEVPPFQVDTKVETHQQMMMRCVRFHRDELMAAYLANRDAFPATVGNIFAMTQEKVDGDFSAYNDVIWQKIFGIPMMKSTDAWMADQQLGDHATHPAFLYEYASHMMADQRHEEALQQLFKVDAGMQRGSWSRHKLTACLFKIGMCYAALNKQDDQAAHPYQDRYIREVERILHGDHDYAYIPQHLVLMMLYNSMEHCGARAESFPGLCERIIAVGNSMRNDPMVMTVVGYAHIQLAWDVRGSGWANDVSEGGWKKFNKHLEAADDCLRQAWSLGDQGQPHFNQTAFAMITVSMGRGCGPEEELAWLQKAMQVERDSADGFKVIENAWLPRWGGSYELLMSLGRRAAETKDYDSDLPWRFVEIAACVKNDKEQMESSQAAARFYKSDDLWGEVKAIGEGYLAHDQDPELKNWHAFRLSMFAYETGRYDESSRYMDMTTPEYRRRGADTISGLFPSSHVSNLDDFKQKNGEKGAKADPHKM